MIDPASIKPIEVPAIADRATGPAGASGPDLGAQFADALRDARALEKNAETASVQFAAGDPSVGIHEVVIAAEKASVALRYATTLKNKAVEAYRELMNTQV
jgi:flagellar hook-basal body complex protein FliE